MVARLREIDGYENRDRRHLYTDGNDPIRLVTLMFLSEATFDLGLMGVLHLFTQSYRNNMSREVTGALYYDGKEFFQVMEGEPEVVNDIWQIIKNDFRHQHVTVISKNIISIRAHDNWSMYLKDGSSMAMVLPQYQNAIGELAVNSVRDLNVYF